MSIYVPRIFGGPAQYTPSQNPYGVTIQSQGNVLNPVRVTDMTHMGIGWCRYFVDWTTIETGYNASSGAPIYDFSLIDDCVSKCNAAGISVVFTLQNPPAWRTYGWAGPIPPPTGTVPCDSKNWAPPSDAAQFASDVATRYNGNNGHGFIAAIESANEGYDDGASSCQEGHFAIPLQQALYTAVKAASPTCLVGAPAQLQLPKTHAENWIKDFYFPLTGSGGGGYCDYHQLHFYPGPRGPNTDDGVHATLAQYAGYVVKWATAAGFPNVGIWVTETGFAQNNLDGSSGPCAPLASYAEQACLLQEMLDGGRLSNGVIDKIFLYTLAGSDGYSPVSGTGSEVFHEGYYLYAGGGLGYGTGYSTQYPVWSGGSSPATLSVAPATLSFAGTQHQPDPASQSVTLSDTGTTSTAWTSSITYASGSGWLALSPVSGTLSGGGSQPVSISATIGTLSPGSYSATVTFTAVSGGSTASVAVTLSVAAQPTSGSIVSQDTFTRLNQSGWGTASDGFEAWSEVIGTAALSIASNTGKVATNTGATLVTLGSGMLCNGDFKVRFTTNNNAAQAGLLARYQNTSNYVRCEVLNGTVRFRKNVAGTPSLLSPTAAVTIANNTAYWLHVNTSGSTYHVNVWADGGAEPGGWLLSCTDSSFSAIAGQYGLFASLATGTDTLSYDQFLVTTTFNTYYVSVSGADSNPGTSAQPWKTLAKVASTMQAGDTIYVGDGSYAGQVMLATSGTAFAPILLQALDEWKATIGETATHGIGSYCLNIAGDYVTADSFAVTGPDVQWGILLADNYSYVQHCWIHDVCQSFDPGTAGGGGIGNTISGFAASGATIRDNRVERIGSTTPNANVHGIAVQMSNPGGAGEVYNNLIFNCAGYGISLSQNPQNWIVTNNTIVHNLTGGIACNGNTGSGYFADYDTIQNNILYANGSGTYFPALWSASDYCGTHNTFRDNLAFSPGGTLTVEQFIPRALGGTLILETVVNTAIYDFTPANVHALQTATNLPNADPLFVNYQPDGSGDYHLSMGGSPAIDTGYGPLSPATDFDGVARPQGGGIDVGAYESLAPLTLTCGGRPTLFLEDTFHLIEKIDERQRFQVTAIDYTGTQFHSFSERVVVTDPVLGRLFSGYVADVKQDKSNTQADATLEHQLDNVGNEHLPGKRTSNLLYPTPTYAGKIVTDMVDQVLAAEGVIAYYATHTDDSENDFAQGILSGVQATNNNGGDLELSGASGFVSASYTSQNAWAAGTLSNVVANSGGDLSLIGATRLWDTGDYSNQTLYGTGSPTQGVSQQHYLLTTAAQTAAVSRLDFAGNWADGAGGHPATIAVDVLMTGITPYTGLTYRTTSWSNSDQTFAYAVSFNLNTIQLKKGSNGGAPSSTILASQTFSPNLGAGWYRLQVVVSGNTHTVSVNGTTYLTYTDSSSPYTAPGMIGLRNHNLETYGLTLNYDSFGVMQALSGTWTSPSTSVNAVSSIVSSIISWDTSLSTGGTVTVQSSINGGSTWSNCSNGGSLPGLGKGASGTGKSLLIKIALSTSNTSKMPDIQNLQWSITGGYGTSGSRTTLSSGTTYGTDTFTRGNQSGWGNASDGQSWNFDQGLGTLAIASNEGTVSGTGTFNYLHLGGQTPADINAAVRLNLGNAADECSILLRYANSSNHYRVSLGLTNMLTMERKVKGTKTTLASTAFTATAGTYYWLRFQCQGTALSARAWADGSNEPAGWMLSATDTSFANGNFGLYSNPTTSGIDSFDHLTAVAAGTGGPGLDLTPVGQLGASFVSWVANLPPSTSLGVDISLDEGVTWTEVTNQNGGPIPGLNGQPEPTTDSFSSDTSANYTSTSAVGGNTGLTLYGTSVAAGTLPSAGKAAIAAGGTETSTLTKLGSGLNYSELTALGTSSPWAGAGSIRSPTGKGWLWDSTALEGQTIPSGPWSAMVTSQAGGATGSAFTADVYLQPYKYDSVAHTYTLIGTLDVLAQNPGSGVKFTASLPAVTLPQVSFTTGQKLYWHVWPHVTANGLGSTSNLFAYEGNAASNGISNDVQINTPGYAPTGSGGSVASWSYDTAHSRLIATGGVQAVYYYNAAAIPNIDLLCDLDESDSGGLTWNYIDGQYFYALAVCDNASSIGTPNTVTLYRTSAGVQSQVAQASISFVRGTYHRVRATTYNGGITITVDGDAVITYTDPSPLDGGVYGLYTNGGTARFYQLWTQPLGDNVSGIIVNSRLRLATTDVTVTPQVLSLTIAAFGPQIDVGALIPSANYAYTYCDKNLDDLAKQSNYSWWVDQHLVLYFNHRQGTPAPWIAQSNNLGLSSDVEMDSNLLVEVSGDVYRNRQILTGVTNFGNFTDSFVGDGTTTSFTLRYPVVATTSIPSITLDGIRQQVGVKGTSGAQWYYASGDGTIAQDSSGTALASTDTLVVSYVGSFIDVVIANNTAAQAALQAIEGASGIIEEVQDVSSPGMLYDAAVAYANALLTRYCIVDPVTNLPTGRTLTFKTYRDGLQAGMVLAAFIVEENLYDAQLLIVQVDVSLQVQPDNTRLYSYVCQASELPRLASFGKLLSEGLLTF